MIIAQVCLRLATLKGHSKMSSFTVLGGAKTSIWCDHHPANMYMWAPHGLCWVYMGTKWAWSGASGHLIWGPLQLSRSHMVKNRWAYYVGPSCVTNGKCANCCAWARNGQHKWGPYWFKQWVRHGQIQSIPYRLPAIVNFVMKKYIF